ncbi:MAG TPA: hypothetical protein PLJ78_07585 [Anaerolineae bacterium]|nr:hypothetical protein [Anaerolineae bacterium]HQK13785.1 hypothetical protein [Anaerolineae bacterium]
MLPISKPPYWLEKKMRRKTGYPAATIACYGPDDKFASKIVVGIVPSEKEEDDILVQKWFSEEKDVRSDTEIARQVLEYIAEHNVRRVIIVDRIIGCPHEEGIDYPKGEKCPLCPFWANRDRWTGEIIE